MRGLFFGPNKEEVMYQPDRETFRRLAGEGNLIPVSREILADTLTPVSTLLQLRGHPHVFLLESVEGGEKWGRYSFLGVDPRTLFRVRGEDVILTENGVSRRLPHGGDPLKILKGILTACRPVDMPGLPRFYGGAVGYLGYEMVRYFERLPARPKEGLDTDDAVFFLTDTILIFDNVRHTVRVVACARTDEDADLERVYAEATRRIDALCDVLAAPGKPEQESGSGGDARADAAFASNLSPEAFRDMVRKAKEYILAGDVIQVVLSQRFSRPNGLDPVSLYRALRFVNPSPYLFYLQCGETVLIGSSPEVMVRLEDGMAELRPIAGTRPRGAAEQEDRRLADDLLADPKERAEHVMLVDLGRNDLGRIARTGSVQVTRYMAVERYSHVMHLVSQIQAQLAPDRDAFDLLRATFPAGTLAGAPKIRAMEIIEELEPSARGVYGGAVGYISFSGNMDLGITIRTILLHGGRIHVQAGAGIVADSDPEKEHEETLNKARALVRAVELAASGLALGGQ